ncbi:MAG TPA: hypothetical protein VL992_14100 [Tepidisphaeraceae bacterium]|nr:hypothetical protein [Tepidisphaeraceae bacterium]
MLPKADAFQQSVNQQIAINQSRTPSQRFEALCELLDAARAMAPTGPEAEERRRRAEAVRQRNREQWRAQLRKFIAAQRTDASEGT